MSDQNPPVPGPDEPEQPAAGGDDTVALPHADAAAGAADTAVLPPQQAPTAPAGPAQAGPVPGWATGPAAGSAAPSGTRGWWGQATSTTGGRVALVAVAVLGSLLVLGGLAVTTALVVGHHRWAGGHEVAISRGDGDGRGQGMGRGQGNGKGQGQGNGQRNGQGQGDGSGRQRGNGGGTQPDRPSDPANPGTGSRMGMGRMAAGLAGILHGEYTTDVSGTPTAMVVQTGQVTAYTAGKTLTVKSTDGFEATYTLDGSTATARGSATLAKGVQVYVVAAKDGMLVSRHVVVG